MDNIHRIFVTLVAVISVCNANAQYVSIKGNQFYDENGKPFYPFYTNYTVDFAYMGGFPTNDFFLVPSIHYGANWNGCDCSYFDVDNGLTDPDNCYVRIRKDFQNIKDMGFNAVHVVGLSPWVKSKKEEVTGNELFPFFCILNVWKCDGIFYPPDSYIITKPLDANPMIISILTGVKGVLQIARELGLKVLLYGQMGDNLHWQGADDDYAEYLALLSAYIYNLPYDIKKSLLAYIIMGEPHWGDNNNTLNRTKFSICETTKNWYDIIKENDPDHLIGCGGVSIAEVMKWDPSVTKTDFYLPHIYPQNIDYEDLYFGANNYKRNFNTSLKRILSQLYWFSENCPLPWVIGETSFSGTDVNYYPQYDGTESEQAEYFAQVLQYAVNAGCSGIGVWQYQEVYWDEAGSGTQNHYGILRYGDTYSANWQTLKKPCVSVFENFLTNGQPPPKLPCEKPDNYYDPYNAKDFNISWETHPNTVRGKVVDNSGNDVPIKDVYIEALVWWYYKDDVVFGESHYKYRWFFDFTDENGDFEIVPYTEIGSDILYCVTYIQGSYIGTELFKAGKSSWEGIGLQMSASIGPIVLDRVSLDKSYENTVVNIGSDQDFTARNNLTLSNITIDGDNNQGGNSEIYARYNVNVNNEFHAEQGSEVHIYTKPVFSECSDYSFFATNEDFMDNKRIISQENNNETSMDIEILFKINQDNYTVQVLPNPNDGVFSVIISNKEPEQIVFLKIKSITGKILYQTKCYCNMFNINQPLAAGMYLLETTVNNQKNVQKVVIK